MRRTAIDEMGMVIDIKDVPQSLKERHLHTYTCPGCKGILIANKGTQRIHHFSHKSNTDCDSWAQEMTEWHMTGQDIMSSLGGRLEVSLEENGISHRADVVFDAHSTVCELQHSPISLPMFMERNEFYLNGFDNLVWLFDARDFADRLSFLDGDTGCMRYGWQDGIWEETVNKKGMTSIECSNPRGWFLEAVGNCHLWHSRGLSLALYVAGGDDFSDGYVLEVFPYVRHVYADTECHVWHFSDWVKALANGRLPFMRKSTVRYCFADGHIQEKEARYGSHLPRPEDANPPTKYMRQEWRINGDEADIKSLAMPAHGTIELHERRYLPKAHVSLWLRKMRRGQKRHPDVSFWLHLGTPIDEVIRQARERLGEWRADDYDWDALRDSEYLKGNISMTLPIRNGRHRFCLSVLDADTEEELCERTWHYETTSVADAWDMTSKELPFSVREQYDLDVEVSGLMDAPVTVLLRKKPELLRVDVSVASPTGEVLFRRTVPGSTTWEELRDQALVETENTELYDWTHLPEIELRHGELQRTWRLGGTNRHVTVMLGEENIASIETPYGCEMHEVIGELCERIPSFYQRFTFTAVPDNGRITTDTKIILYRDENATHTILLHDGMSSLPQPYRTKIPYWISDRARPVVPTGIPSPPVIWADKFMGMYLVEDDGSRVLALDSDMIPSIDEAKLAGVRLLQYGYEYDGHIVFNRDEVTKIDSAHEEAQIALF